MAKSKSEQVDTGLLAKLKSAPSRNAKSRWEDRLSAESRAELDRCKAEFKTGLLSVSARQFHSMACEHFGVTVSISAFREYLER